MNMRRKEKIQLLKGITSGSISSNELKQFSIEPACVYYNPGSCEEIALLILESSGYNNPAYGRYPMKDTATIQPGQQRQAFKVGAQLIEF
jgi:hypothetical protein